MVLSGGAIIALLHYVVSLENKAALEDELRSTRHAMELEQIHYKSVEERREELARIRHDFNNQLAAIGYLIRMEETADAEKMIRQLSADIEDTRENPYCAIPVVNAVLSEKETVCREKGVLLQTELDIPYPLSVEPLHLCSIFANLLDNAIRGAEECGRKPSRISLTSAVAGDYLMIKTVNPANPPKMPKPGHGYGSRILAEVAEQYEGSFQSGYENGMYTAVVSLLVGNET